MVRQVRYHCAQASMVFRRASGIDESKGATLQCKLSTTAMTLIQGLSSLFWSTRLLITQAKTATEAPQGMLLKCLHVADTTCRG